MVSDIGVIGISPIISIVVLFLLMTIMIIVYVKLKIFLVVLVLFLFSLLIGFIALRDFTIPFSPYLQLLFILFQLTIFILVSIQFYEKE